MKMSTYNQNTIRLIQILTILFGVQINILSAKNVAENNTAYHFSLCATCCTSASVTQTEILFNQLVLLAPTTPSEALFPDDPPNTEITLAPTTPPVALFDDDPEFINPVTPDYLAPVTPEKADFID
jgi:hypothetical protein